MFLRNVIALSSAKFEEDVRYLNKLFGTVDHIEGCIVRLQGSIGHNNYKSNFRDPFEERTLIVEGINSVVLFFKHILKGLPEFKVFDGVTIVEEFNFTKGYKVVSRFVPADLPCYLESYIADSIGNAFSNLSIKNDGFFNKHYSKGGMIPLSDVRKHPEWRNEYANDVDTMFVNICKSCGLKALKGCCSEYSSTNRKKLKMVIGWHETHE